MNGGGDKGASGNGPRPIHTQGSTGGSKRFTKNDDRRNKSKIYCNIDDMR